MDEQKDETNDADKVKKLEEELRLMKFEEGDRKERIRNRGIIAGSFAGVLALGALYLGLNYVLNLKSEPRYVMPAKNKYVNQSGSAYLLNKNSKLVSLVLMDEDNVPGVEKILMPDKTESGAVILPTIAEMPKPENKNLYPGIIHDSTVMAFATDISRLQKKLAYRLDSLEYVKEKKWHVKQFRQEVTLDSAKYSKKHSRERNSLLKKYALKESEVITYRR